MGELRALLAGDPVTAAEGLVGWVLRTTIGSPTAVALTEVEAYGGKDDPASHAGRGETPRNRAMFGPPGTVYVYRAYGLHWCANVVTAVEGFPGAVLFRAGVPVEGRSLMERRRGRSDHLTDGPGKLCAALGIDGTLDGSSIFSGPVRLTPPRGALPPVEATPRIGVTRAVGRKWRFVAGKSVEGA